MEMVAYSLGCGTHLRLVGHTSTTASSANSITNAANCTGHSFTDPGGMEGWVDLVCWSIVAFLPSVGIRSASRQVQETERLPDETAFEPLCHATDAAEFMASNYEKMLLRIGTYWKECFFLLLV